MNAWERAAQLGEQRESFNVVRLLAAPLPGTQPTFVIPSGVEWEIISMRLVLTTDANVANRRIALSFSDGTSVFYNHELEVTQAANLAVGYHFAAGLGFQQTVVPSGSIVIGIPPFCLKSGYTFRVGVTAVQVGDQVSAPVLYVNERVGRGERAEIEYELAQTISRLNLLADYIEPGA